MAQLYLIIVFIWFVLSLYTLFARPCRFLSTCVPFGFIDVDLPHLPPLLILFLLLGFTVCCTTSWTVWRRKEQTWHPSVKSSGWACSRREKKHKRRTEPLILLSQEEQHQPLAQSQAQIHSEGWIVVSSFMLYELSLTDKAATAEQHCKCLVFFVLFFSFSHSLMELRHNIGRLLINYVPALDLDQVNYECNVIDEILEQVLSNEESGVPVGMKDRAIDE